MARQMNLIVESLEGKALLSGLSNGVAPGTIITSPPQLITHPDPQPQPPPVTPAATTRDAGNTITTPPQLITHPDPQPQPPPVTPTASSDPGTTTITSPPQPVTHPDPQPQPPPVSPAASSGATSSTPVQITLTTNHSTYRPGHPVHIKLTVTNTGTSPVSLSPNGVAKGLTVSNGSKVVWHPKHAAGHNLSVQALQPGKSIVLTEVWKGGARHAGTYTIQDSVAGATGSATIRIR